MKLKLPIYHLTFLFILAIVAGWLFFQTEKNMSEVEKLQIEVNQQMVNVDKLAELKTQLPTFTREIGIYRKTLPSTEAEVADFAATVEQMARGLGLQITYHFDDFTELVEVSGQNIYGLGSEIVLEGSFQSLTDFMARLSGLPYFFKVDKLTISKQETKPGIKVSVDGFLMMNISKKI